MAKAAKVWTDLDALGVPGIKGVWSPPEAAGWGTTVVSIEQRYAGHASQVATLAAQCMGGATTAETTGLRRARCVAGHARRRLLSRRGCA